MLGHLLPADEHDRLEHHLILPLARDRFLLLLETFPCYGESEESPFYAVVWDRAYCSLMLQRREWLLQHGQTEQTQSTTGQVGPKIRRHSYFAESHGDLFASEQFDEVLFSLYWAKASVRDLPHLRVSDASLHYAPVDGCYYRLHEKHWDQGYWETYWLRYEAIQSMLSGRIPRGGCDQEFAVEAWKKPRRRVHSDHVSAPT